MQNTYTAQKRDYRLCFRNTQGSLTVCVYLVRLRILIFCKPRLLLPNSPWESQPTVKLLREIIYSNQQIPFIMFC